ncbi:hypothetical protein T10_12395 [Trichinella papuae]|uniref:Uncharacterized protein n=1 Tax=Trichinella papuae TaxID=268474 RepID=A0A0V1M9P4_9BILA|nr:hypothetical protein T10_12395 [Trichinella papuae]
MCSLMEKHLTNNNNPNKSFIVNYIICNGLHLNKMSNALINLCQNKIKWYLGAIISKDLMLRRTSVPVTRPLNCVNIVASSMHTASAGSVTAHCDTSFSRVLASPDTDMGDFLPYPDFSPLLKTVAFIPGFAAVFISLLIVKGAFALAAATCSRALPKEFPAPLPTGAGDCCHAGVAAVIILPSFRLAALYKIALWKLTDVFF